MEKEIEEKITSSESEEVSKLSFWQKPKLPLYFALIFVFFAAAITFVLVLLQKQENRQYTTTSNGILVITDKENYAQGEVVTATAENNSNQPAYYSYTAWELYKYKDSGWEKVPYPWTIPDVQPPYELLKTEPGNVTKATVQLEFLPQVLQDSDIIGKYKLEFSYTKNSNKDSEWYKASSNEFKVVSSPGDGYSNKPLTLIYSEDDHVLLGEKIELSWQHEGLDYYSDEIILCLVGYDSSSQEIPAKEPWNEELCTYISGHLDGTYLIDKAVLEKRSFSWIVPGDIEKRFVNSPESYSIRALVFDNRPEETHQWEGCVGSDEVIVNFEFGGNADLWDPICGENEKIEVAARSGESKTVLARRAVSGYLNKLNLVFMPEAAPSLTAEEKIYAEDYIKDRLDVGNLYEGDKVDISCYLVEEAVMKARLLTISEKESLEKYSSQVEELRVKEMIRDLLEENAEEDGPNFYMFSP